MVTAVTFSSRFIEMSSNDAAEQRLPESQHYNVHMQASFEESPSHQPDGDLNKKDDFGENFLMQCLRLHASNDFIQSIIEKEVDLNIANDVGETALHLAILRPTLTVSLELIKRGVNINTQDEGGRTPLHDAVTAQNVQAVNMLLYYGADVNLVDEDELTPFMYAADKPYIAEMLFLFYNEFCPVTVCHCIAPYAATHCRNPMMCHLIGTDLEFHYISTYKQHPLAFSIYFESARLFKLIWKKFDYETYASDQEPLLSQYVCYCDFVDSEFLDCLHLMLQSSFALVLMRDCMTFMVKHQKPQNGFFYQLLRKLKRKNVQQEDRMAVLNLCFYLGAKITIQDVNFAYETYGFNKELEAFIYNMKPINSYDKSYLALPTFILAMESDYTISNIIKLLVNYLHLPYRPSIIKSIGYFFLPHYIKLKVYDALEVCWDKSYQNRHIIHERLAVIPKVPSLLELSRNQTRKYIKRKCANKAPCYFHDIVRHLDVPLYVKDIICFKTPVYK